MYKLQNTGQLTNQIDELKKEVSALKRERKALFFIALCGVSYAVLQFAPVAAIVLFVVSFSLCFLEDIVKGELTLIFWLFSISKCDLDFEPTATF